MTINTKANECITSEQNYNSCVFLNSFFLLCGILKLHFNNEKCTLLLHYILGWHVWMRRGVCVGSCWGNRREGDHWGDLGIDGWIILGWISRRWDVGIWTGLG